MKTLRRWLLANAKRVPFYINGYPRNGPLDVPDDLAQLATYTDAKNALQAKGKGWLLGFALGPDGGGGHWQGIDFDDVQQNKLADLANHVPGYVEISPSEDGAHAIGYGRPFTTLGANGSGIEAYAKGRYFTVTERPIIERAFRDDGLICLANYVEQALAPRHGKTRAAAKANGVELIPIDPKTVSELRSALNHLKSDEYGLWINMGHALRELGDTGRGLWLDWSKNSEKYKPTDAKKWETFKADATGFQAVFAEAQRQGWVNPSSNAAQIGGTTGAQSVLFESRKPRDVLRKVTPPPFAFDDVPLSIGQFAYYYSQATGFDQSGVIVACVTAAASVIDDGFKLTVRRESNWHVSARQWSFLCGGPSAGKSPSIRAASDHIKQLEVARQICTVG